MTIGQHFVRALRWATAAGADKHDVHAAWAAGHAVDVPIGRSWDVLRVTATVGWDAIEALTTNGVTLGPILWCPPRATIEFLVPRGSQWAPQPAVRLATSGYIRWPAPEVTLASGRQATCGRTWVVPPLITVPAHTSVTYLYQAVQGSLIRHAAAAETQAVCPTAHG
ncbi:hypothetical protein [Streptomyces noursei]|uniref:Uncharacterized protein n=1 Tax=Streptomyces noursei TaxID=1971 RepID=A0A401QRT4_STRNR|nr:hypothetical protein [Streptomyces noursei]EOT04366.1 hypothetical protein K530_08924 [Streptomyces noursei CCRC 11814]EXU86586.1 hypothetical protein P354_41460 [Streptomyces noursei PD-1]UWS77566.1 hypothetical protein N1H47_40880 [Streptomyces noursei]UWS77604.1 hypothetical protein N1H47_40675 [Streptomyces noursei]GCB88012.1 hypothetical protein SALB_00681 [Streptomyces noursei]